MDVKRVESLDDARRLASGCIKAAIDVLHSHSSLPNIGDKYAETVKDFSLEMFKYFLKEGMPKDLK